MISESSFTQYRIAVWAKREISVSCLAQGRYIGLTDVDDVSVPECLAWQIDFMEKHQEVSGLGEPLNGSTQSAEP
jgi:hypothetical protein